MKAGMISLQMPQSCSIMASLRKSFSKMTFRIAPPAVTQALTPPDFVAEVSPFTGTDLADVDDHVDLVRAVVDGPLRLIDLQLDRAGTVRKTDDGSGSNAGPVEQLRGNADEIRLDADACAVALHGDGHALDQLLVVQHGMEQRMVDHPGEFVNGPIRHTAPLFQSRTASRITMFSVGTSRCIWCEPVLTAAIWSTTSIPSTTSPNTQ